MILNSNHADVNEVLLPADVLSIYDQYNDIITSAYIKDIRGEKHIYPKIKLTPKVLSALLPLKEHPVHGITGIHVIENYDDNGHVRKYSYQWKVIIPKMGIQSYHISAWGNEPHDDPNTPEEFKVESEPHHHHHVPKDWRKRKRNWSVWTLEEAFEFVAHYIRSGQEYKP
jgi:hypothetical protein